jgi:hypothetical protein
VGNFNEISQIFEKFHEILTEFDDIILKSFCTKNFPSKFRENLANFANISHAELEEVFDEIFYSG